MVEADRLTKKYGSFTAADSISFRIRRGEIFGLLGPNGAGKSTTFKMMCGLARPTSGRALVAGRELGRSGGSVRRRIGYMAQKFSLYDGLSVRQNLAFFSGIYGLSGRAQKAKIEEMVEIFHFQNILDDNSGDISLGHKQRLALACATMHGPDVLFLDEPTSAFRRSRGASSGTTSTASSKKGVTVMVTTHFMDEAEYCDRIALIYRGRAIAVGTPDELRQSVADGGRPIRPWRTPSSRWCGGRTGSAGEAAHEHPPAQRPDAQGGIADHPRPEFDPDRGGAAAAADIHLRLRRIARRERTGRRNRRRRRLPRSGEFRRSVHEQPLFQGPVGPRPPRTRSGADGGDIRGIVVIPGDFASRLGNAAGPAAPVQIITDGSEPNTANFVQIMHAAPGRSGCASGRSTAAAPRRRR
ncbi:MAG: ABC transporter ATP-binding protein [Victivallis sp.]